MPYEFDGPTDHFKTLVAEAVASPIG